MHVLVIHDYGPLGRVLLERLRNTSVQVTPLLVSDLESADLTALEGWIPDDTDLIVNALWLADPEIAEKNPEAAHKASFSLPVALAKHACERNIALLQLSSCYVFDGRKQNAYISSNPGQPCNELGNWQWECEQAVRTLLPRHLILRTGWSLGRFIRKVQSVAAGSDVIRLPSKCHGQPVTVSDLSRVITAIVQQVDCGAEVWGTYQYAGAEDISLYELGLAITGLSGIPSGIRVLDETPAWAAFEPVNATMICTKIRNTFGVKQLPWRSGLAEELELLSLNGDRQLTDEPAG
ncbi:dTDP-4-dehydrorhamnose reductase [Marinobacter vulgaris]|uniref:dTDP-4-dehydrorhamnose reductase n=1 Tax=Marinobacter vulgaris TaxID=1928331 RepID=A0A2V3ZLZ9_9GAMM|nr:sugar nucleotide-binding protein [Marinobacter vulgaris]PXX90188.1 dTDP-4-dehydrorhamnose reductase [Marinobacter vulgaris]TSJ69788.1 sugar nucleotide-binding protein [Marinobacter vulgaris]